jgi:hypothetical protein
VQAAGAYRLSRDLGQAAQQTKITANKEEVTNNLLNNFYGILEDRVEK